MKIVKTDDLKGGEYLAKAVFAPDGQMLMYEGTRIRFAQIDKLKEYGIVDVQIFEEDVFSGKPKEVIKEELHADCQKKVKTVLNNYVFKEEESLKEISEAAERIINDIFSRDEIAENVYDIKERNADLYDHSITVSALSILTAIKMNLDQNAIFSIGVGSLLHDLGLKYILLDYQNVDPYHFSPEGLFEFRKHTVYGFSSVEKEKWMSSAARKIILFHHEHMNGTGYPLKQKNIPIEVRIVTVCDTFDDMICGIGHEQVHVMEAIEYLKRYKNVYFDGRVVDIFLQFVAAYPVGTVVMTNMGEEGVVVEQNEHYTDRPIVKLLKDRSGKHYKGEKLINLSENRRIFIEKVIN